MTFAAPQPIASGMPYRISHTDGRPAAGASDFVGEHSLLLHLGAEHWLIAGVGVADLNGTAVRFYQKDVDNDGKDIRIWRFDRSVDQQYTAVHEPAM